MNFQPSEITQHAAQTARDFANQFIRPHVMEWFKEMGRLGMMGVLVPHEYGGAGLSYFEYKTIIEEVAKVCGSVGLSLAAHNSLCTGHILSFANEEQKKKYLPKLATAEWIGAWGLTEPGTGSDAGNMKCTAVKDGNEWVINGTKNWITHGISNGIYSRKGNTGF
jgi:alkylation response protein AidB-like acyl-CoA dehydrogenase